MRWLLHRLLDKSHWGKDLPWFPASFFKLKFNVRSVSDGPCCWVIIITPNRNVYSSPSGCGLDILISSFPDNLNISSNIKSPFWKTSWNQGVTNNLVLKSHIISFALLSLCFPLGGVNRTPTCFCQNLLYVIFLKITEFFTSRMKLLEDTRFLENEEAHWQ